MRSRATEATGPTEDHRTDPTEPVDQPAGPQRQRWLSAMLTTVRIPSRARILELGTDPDHGYSATILEQLSHGGTVCSIHETADLIRRARLVQHYGYRPSQISFHHGQLRHGWAPGAPYDLIVSFVPLGWLPRRWLRQTAPSGAIVMPLQAERLDRLAFLQVTVHDHQPARAEIITQLDGDPRRPRVRVDPHVQLHRPPHADAYTITCDSRGATRSLPDRQLTPVSTP